MSLGNIALSIFAAAMLFACARHLLAFARRERALRQMQAAVRRAGQGAPSD